MSWLSALGIMLGGVVGLMLLSTPVAIAFFAINIVGAMLFLGGASGIVQLVRNMLDAVGNFALGPIPLFILMGEALFHTGVAFKAVNAIDRVISRVPGRLSVVSVIGGTIFASLSGSTIANTAMLGTTLLPQMLERGYEPRIAIGPIIATGGIAMLIPPSALAVVLGSLAGLSISKLLIAGIMPGIMMAVLFLVYIMARCYLDPTLAPSYDVPHVSAWNRWRPFATHVLPLFGLFFAVVGSILLGWASVTESAALGAFGALLAAALYRALTWQNLLKSLRETAKVSIMVLFIIAGSITFSQVLAISGAVDHFVRLVIAFNAPPQQVLAIMLLVLLFLGCFMEQVSMMLITVPLFFPVAAGLNIDPIWLGVMMLLAIELGLSTPPFGLLIFVMRGIVPRHISIVQIYSAAFPFIMLGLLVLLFLLLFPDIALWLPSFVG